MPPGTDGTWARQEAAAWYQARPILSQVLAQIPEGARFAVVVAADTHPSCAGGTIAGVRKLIKIALIALGIRALLRWWKRRRAEAELGAAFSPPDPADQLRQKLAESRSDDTAEIEETPDAPIEASVADRRAEVHEQGRAALDEMKNPDEA